MGQKDLSMQPVLQDKEYFADICNMMLFHGKPFIRPEHLKDMDSTIVNPVEEPGGESNSVKKIRDSMKELEIVQMESHNASYVILGIEHQSAIDYSMPVRNLLYDAMQYENQVEQLGHMKRKDRLKPVITMVVYTGESPWTYPHSFRDILDMTGLPEELKAYIPDTEMPVLDVRHSQNLEQLRTGLKQAFRAMQLYRDKDEFYEFLSDPNNGFDRMPGKLVNMLEKVLNLELPEYEAEREVNMCEAMQGIIQDAKASARAMDILNLMENTGWSMEQVMNMMKIPLEEREMYQKLVEQLDGQGGHDAPSSGGDVPGGASAPAPILEKVPEKVPPKKSMRL